MITGKTKATFLAELTARSHAILSGLDKSSGGADEAPNPHELLEASLAACTILTAEWYAGKKHIPLEATSATVKILAEGKETRISREVTFHGKLTDDQRMSLAAIVEKCPIHNLLVSHVTIETKFPG